jgi:diaminopimelate epimerase
MRFAKGHGTENDFVILVDPAGDQGLSLGLAARLCDRRAGIGADGVLRAVRTEALAAGSGPEPAGGGSGATPGPNCSGRGSQTGPTPEWFMDYRNHDGSTAEMCGNGIRVFARYLAGRGLVTGPALTVATRSGSRQVRLEEDGNVTAEMGAVAVLGTGRAVFGGPGGLACEGLRVSVGNPHLACLVDAPLAGFDLTGPPLLDPTQFPEGGNVELVRVTGPGTAEMRVHERGSGETRSCGTGAVAAAAAAAMGAGQDHGSWQVSVPGGQLEPGAGWLRGPAVIVAEGELDDAWLAAASATAR